MILVYALASRGARVRPPLRTLTVGGISAIVRGVRRAPAATEPTLRAHHRMLSGLTRTAPAVLPVRFGTVFADVEELRFVLQARQQTLRRSLSAVRGRAQMTVRFAHAHIPPTSQETAGSGRDYLRARAARQAVPEFEPVRRAVRRWVRDERMENQGRVASVYHLVPRGSIAAYRRALLAAADAGGLRVLVTGPFPPYAFASTF